MSLFELGPAPFYAPPAGRRDEMVDGAGAVRPAWTRVHSSLLGAGPEALRRDAARIQRALHSHGTTFRPDGSENRWALDPIPMVVERSDWAALGRALAQRARVLEMLLADVFGEQRLLRSGLLPTDAILSHRDYLRPCIGVPPGGGRHLVMYAADVARRTDGSFTVISDRTQSPSGAGYALENREVMSSTYPDLVRRSGVEPLRPWFSALRLTLAEVAPPGVDDPRIVMLTPGPLSETYFEHGFLSRTLGYTLVEPADLTVREGHVWLKSVTGLEPVHVILRREDAEWTDSLELRTDSLLGVPGLVEAARRRNVSIVNPLGSGLAENPALLPYLDELTRTLLDEEPLISSAPTWWCGDPIGRSHVLANLERLVIKQVDRSGARQNLFGRVLSLAGREELRGRIEAHPHLFVGQEEQHLPTAPAFDEGGIVPRYSVMRSFLVADGGGYSYMDGALTRTSLHPGEVTMSADGVSKDTWIVASGSDNSWSSRRVPALPQVDLRASVTSRAAESMYWIGRNLERAETVIRLVRSIEQSLSLWPELRDEAGGTWMLTVEAAVAAVIDDPLNDDGAATGRSVLTEALVDARRPRSLVTSLRFLLAGGRSVRELLSNDAFRMLSDMSALHGRLASVGDAEAREIAEASIAPLSAMSGLMMESMVRDPGWKFLDLGRRIERSLLLCQILRATMIEPLAEAIVAPLYETVLSGWECLGAYRRRHRSDIERSAMFALLFTDQSNPRSIRFQVERMVEDLSGLPDVGPDGGGLHGRVNHLLADLDSLSGDGSALELLSRSGGIGRSERLAELLTSLDRQLGEIADLTELGFFAQVGPGTVIGNSEGFWEPVQ